MIRVIWPHGGRPLCWDQGLILAATSGELWPLPIRFEHREPHDLVHANGDDGAIVVASGTMLAEREQSYGRDFQQGLNRLPWALLFLGSDEQLRCTRGAFRSDAPMWRQYRRPGHEAERWVLQGWPAGTPAMLEGIERRPIGERAWWGFRGQAGHPKRDEAITCMKSLEGARGSFVHVTPGFIQGLPRVSYLAELAGCAIAPAPGGPHTPDSFRLYEALELGCLPVVDNAPPYAPAGFDYWTSVLGERPPFPVVNGWDRGFRSVLLEYGGGEPLQRAANRAGAWWRAYQRRFAFDLLDDVCSLANLGDIPMTANALGITVVITASPIPSHPSTEMIEQVIARIRAYPDLADAEIIIACDGVPAALGGRSADYEEWKRRVLILAQRTPGLLPVFAEEHVHQAELTRRALALVRTHLVFFVEGDTYPMGPIDVAGIARVLDEDGVNVVRLHIQEIIDPEHRVQPLYLDETPRDIAGVPMIRTWQWSQRPHFARTDWYRGVIDAYFGAGARCFVEDVLWSIVDAEFHANGAEAAHRKFGVWLYAPRGAPEVAAPGFLRSGHFDGRRGDPKIEQVFAYPGEPPPGAPWPGPERR